MKSPAIRKLRDILLVNVPPDLTDSEVLTLRRSALQALKQHRSCWMLLDFSEVLICDSFFGRFIHSMANMAAAMGAKVVVCGLGDAVVETLVDMGFDLSGIQAVLDVDDALELRDQARRARTGQFGQL